MYEIDSCRSVIQTYLLSRRRRARLQGGFARRVDQRRPHPLATAQHGVAHGLMQTFGHNGFLRQDLIEYRFNMLYAIIPPSRKIYVFTPLSYSSSASVASARGFI